MEILKIDIPAQDRVHLDMLATHLERLPKDYTHFEMGYFSYWNDEVTGGSCNPQIYSETAQPVERCGSVGCAVGHGPAAGIPYIPGETWTAFWLRQLITIPYYDLSDVTVKELKDAVFEFLFAGSWDEADNTSKGAAQRIRFYLHHSGIPDPRIDNKHCLQRYIDNKDIYVVERECTADEWATYTASKQCYGTAMTNPDPNVVTTDMVHKEYAGGSDGFGGRIIGRVAYLNDRSKKYYITEWNT